MVKVMKILISVVIPTYNGYSLLRENLPFLIVAVSNFTNNYEIIIADDFSTDESIRFIKDNYPKVILVENKINGGFSKNINTGIQKAKGKWVMLLNNDIKLTPSYFVNLKRHLHKENIFGVMGKIIDEKENLLEGLKYPNHKTLKINAIKNINVKCEADRDYFTFYLSGANAIVNSDKLQKLGGFNELFSPFYHEDLDLSLRAWRNQWLCYYEPSSICFHDASSTIRKVSKKGYVKKIATKNRILLHYIHLSKTLFYVWLIKYVTLLPFKFMIGKTVYFDALKMIFLDRIEIKSYREHFYKSQVKSLESINDVKKRIVNQII